MYEVILTDEFLSIFPKWREHKRFFGWPCARSEMWHVLAGKTIHRLHPDFIKEKREL